MQAEILTAGEDVAELVRGLRELVPDGESVSSGVAEIIAAVRAGGDEAVLGYTAQFDTGGVAVESLQVPVGVLRGAAAELDPDVRRGLEFAIAN
ncbi:MAG TPA: histidinol dehydrogenase, partial [Solirubrobacteraceae bacterium]